VSTAAIAELPAVLVADDQEDICTALGLALKGQGFEIETARSPREIVSAVGRRRFDAVLMDLNYARDTTSGGEGLEVLSRLHALDRSLPVIVMTAWGTIELAVEAMRRGAVDFLLKPWNNAALLDMLRTRARRLPGREAARDLEAAACVQTRLLPQALPASSTLECAALCVEAGAVGGDGYDVMDLGEGRLAVVLTDVSGKGVPAALLSAGLQAMIRSRADQARDDLAGALRAANRTFAASTSPEHYATLFMGVYDGATRRLRYVNAGHNPPLLLGAGGGCRRLAATAPVIGLLDEWDVQEGEIALGPGETLLVYSDGVSEARAGEVEWGEEGLIARLRAEAATPLAEVPAAIIAAATAFAGGRQDDDMTVLVLRGRPAG
jgi:sigma-B regulation protein RsbU (phosphoserine phosphatase)